MARRKPIPSPKHGAKLTRELAELLVAHLSSGLFREPAAQLVGIHPDTLKRWMREGRKDLDDAVEAEERGSAGVELGPYGRLVIEVLAAEARVEAKLTGVITKIAFAGKDERAKLAAAQWYLERKRHLVYGRGALRVDLPRDDAEAYDGTTEDQDSLELLTHLSRYAATRAKPPTQ